MQLKTRRILSAVAGAGLAIFFAGHVLADTVSITNPSGYYLDLATDGNLHQVTPTNPMATTDTLDQSPETNTAVYALDNSGFSIGVTQSRGGTFSQENTTAQGQIYFTIAANAPTDVLGYSAAANYKVTDVDPSNPGYDQFDDTLVDVTTGTTLFTTQQVSENTADEDFILGTSNGDYQDNVSGSLTGTLIAGDTYEWNYAGAIQDYPNDDSGASATGNFSLSFTDTSVPLPAALPAGAGLLALLGVSRMRRII